MTADPRARLLARIRKCLALAAGASEHEAAAALATARRLMDEYGVDQLEVDLSAVGEADARGGGRVRPPRWEALLVVSVMRAMTVKGIFNSAGVTFVGLTPAPEIASYAFTALYRQLKRARADYSVSRLKRCKPARRGQRADAFSEGWASAVYRAVAEIAPEQALNPLVERYLDERHTDLVKVNARAAPSNQAVANDWWNGRDEGRTVRLHHGVGGDGQLALSGGGA